MIDLKVELAGAFGVSLKQMTDGPVASVSGAC